MEAKEYELSLCTLDYVPFCIVAWIQKIQHHQITLESKCQLDLHSLSDSVRTETDALFTEV